MVKRVQLEDNSIHEFPDDASDEEISSLLEQSNPTFTAKQQAEIDQLNRHANAWPTRKLLGIDRTPFDTIRDIVGTALGSGQHIAANLLEKGEQLTRSGLEDPNAPKWNAREFMGLEGDNQIDLKKMIASDPNSMISTITGMAPLLAGGVTSVPRAAMGAGGMTTLMGNPDDKMLSSHIPLIGKYMPEGRLATGIETTILGMLSPELKELPTILNTAKKKIVDVMPNLRPGKMANKIEAELNRNIESVEKTGEARSEAIQQQSKNQVKKLNEDAARGSMTISSYLGQGAKSTEENAAKIADDIRAIHDPAQANASSYYEYALNEADKEREIGKAAGNSGRGLLYEKADPLISTKPQEGEALKASVKKHGFGQVGENFIKEDSLRNAHNLKQEIGFRAGDLRSLGKNRTKEQSLELGELDNMYAQLNSDMKNYMQNRHPNKNVNILKAWETGDKIYQEQVLPLLHNKKLREINRPTSVGGGRKKYVKNIHEAFSDPGARDIILPSGEVKKGPASQLMDMLSQGTKDRILFSKIGANSGENSSSLIKSINDAERDGYSHIPSPELKAGIQDILEKQAKAKMIEEQSTSEVRKIAKNVKEEIERMKKQNIPTINELKEKSRTMRRMAWKLGGYGLLGTGLEELARRNL